MACLRGGFDRPGVHFFFSLFSVFFNLFLHHCDNSVSSPLCQLYLISLFAHIIDVHLPLSSVTTDFDFSNHVHPCLCSCHAHIISQGLLLLDECLLPFEASPHACRAAQPSSPPTRSPHQLVSKHLSAPPGVATCYVYFSDMTEREIYTGAVRAVRRNGKREAPPPDPAMDMSFLSSMDGVEDFETMLASMASMFR